MSKHKLISHVVDADICIGCGSCAGICPTKSITMVWNEYGETNPYIPEGCPPNICVCTNVCPIINPIINTKKENYSYNNIIGNYLGSYAGYSNQDTQRKNGSSGGILTWLLTQLIKDKKVDAVIVVGESDDYKKQLFEFKILEKIEDIEKAASSKYYPVEISEIMRIIKKDRTDKKYALVGLPCLITGVRNSQEYNKKLKSKIKYMFALTCGQLPNKQYTEALANFSGISTDKLKSVNYRIKENTLNARNFSFRAISQDFTIGKDISWNSKPWILWKNSFFIHGACRVCDDVFGKNSDAVFMDAWINKYSDNPKGHSFFTTKNLDIENYIKEKIELNQIELESISIDDVFKSQDAVIRKKREKLTANLYKKQLDGIDYLKRDIKSSKENYKKYKRRVDLEYFILSESKKRYLDLKNNNSEMKFFESIEDIEKKITKLEKAEIIKLKIDKLTNNPFKTLKNIINYQLNKRNKNV